MITKSIKQIIADMNSTLADLDNGDGIAYAYRLINEDGECIYAGQTENLKRRIIQHLSDGKTFCDVKFTRCRVEDANDAEALSIARHMPFMNKSLPTNRFFVTYKSLCEEICRVMLSDKIILELPSGAGKFRYVESETASHILSELSGVISGCNSVADYDFDYSESLVALGEDK